MSDFSFDFTPIDGPSQPPSIVDPRGEEFIAFHNDNPHVYEALVEEAFNWMESRNTDYVSLVYVWNRLRHEPHLKLQIRSYGKYKLDDNYMAYYIRLARLREPGLLRATTIRSCIADKFIEQHYARCA